ncbi:DUF4838 domain-containing protein [Polyangium aurulentum]|uniref:DUF4838 domain-containing protein n=1 Tax=Polyangium aurulentum TaxID=2567896 RepID=UPI0010AE0AEC|nr:DUF4838 domain-containing protein [Polyangium aurulentum]UQA60531.1 DUF4838 domain-containing protein [Polyangium aurulentum]
MRAKHLLGLCLLGFLPAAFTAACSAEDTNATAGAGASTSGSGGSGGSGQPAAPPLAMPPSSTVIVTAAMPTAEEKQAAELLRDWMRRAAHVTEGFDIVLDTDPTSGKVVIAVGATKFRQPDDVADIDIDGFTITRRDQVIVIAGGERRGNYLGAVRFLDVACGVRFYMPGDTFTSLPASPELAAPALAIRSNPATRSFLMTGIAGIGAPGLPGEPEWAKRNALDNRRRGGTHQHNLDAVFPKDKYAAKYPAIYGANGIPCFSEPTLLDAAEETAVEHFTKNPGDEYLAYSVNDTSARCEKDPADDTLYSEVYWKFMNALAERLTSKFPDKKILGLAYAGVRIPPSFPLHEKIIVFTNLHISELQYDGLLNPGGPVEQWLGLAKHHGNHEWGEGKGFLIPRIYTGYFAEFLVKVDSAGVDTGYQHLESYPNYGLDGPKYYVWARTLWDPHADTKAVWAQLTGDLFGAAGPSMLDYFQTLEQLWITWDNVEGPERKLFGWGNQFKSTPASLAQFRHAREALDQAKAAAAGDAVVAGRIDLFAKTFRLTEMLVEQAAAPTVKAGYADEVKAHLESALVPDPMTLYRTSPDDLRGNVTAAIGAVTSGKPVE